MGRRRARAMQAAEFSRERLRTVLPRLRNRLRQVQAAEYTAQWRRDFERVEVKRDTLASEFAELYPKLVAQLIDLFRRVEAVDSECSRVNGSAPANQNRYLFGVELSARNLEKLTITSPSNSYSDFSSPTSNTATAWLGHCHNHL